MTPRIEMLTEELCAEIDLLRFELKQARADCDYWRTQYSQHLHESNENHKDTMGKVLLKLLEPVDNAS